MLAVLALAYAHPEQLVETEWVAAHAADAAVPPAFLPSPAAFEQMMARLGISNRTRVVVYDERTGSMRP